MLRQPTDEVVSCTYNESAHATEHSSCAVDPHGFEKHCTKKNKFGYPSGEPCILIKLNKVSITSRTKNIKKK